jgi:hypothetical protein
VGCHQSDYDGTTNPNHAAAGFSTSCDSCHGYSDPDWFQATYPHTVYPLVGSHTSQRCNACHVNNVYQGLPSECVDCHLDDYNATTDPNHQQSGFPTTCQVCHTPTSWEDATFDHPFPLQGEHATLDCQDCHADGYTGTPTDCVGCHQTDYNGADNPNHIAAGFSTDCDDCHGYADPNWQSGSYPHTVWPLLGNHASQQCTTCHVNDVYQGLPSDCVDCHLDDYNGTSDPNHATAGFPTDCVLCHSPADPSWSDGDFNHVWFPINSGPHVVAECSDCHRNPLNFLEFSCTSGGCHPQGPTNQDHSEVQGYAWDSALCYACHPDGRSEFRSPRHRMQPSHGHVR